MHDVYPGVRIILPSLEERIAQAHIVARTIAAGTKRGQRWTARDIMFAKANLLRVGEGDTSDARARAQESLQVLEDRLRALERAWDEQWIFNSATRRYVARG